MAKKDIWFIGLDNKQHKYTRGGFFKTTGNNGKFEIIMDNEIIEVSEETWNEVLNRAHNRN